MTPIEQIAKEHGAELTPAYSESTSSKDTVVFTYKQLEAFAKDYADNQEIYLLKLIADIRQAMGNTDKLMLDELAPAIAKALQKQSELCSNCNDTGDIHRVDGQYVGKCPCNQQSVPVARLIADPMLLPALKAPYVDWKVDPMTLDIGTDLFTQPPNTVSLEQYNKLLDALRVIRDSTYRNAVTLRAMLANAIAEAERSAK